MLPTTSSLPTKTKDPLDLSLILSAIESCIPREAGATVALHEPCFKGNEWNYVKECLDTRWVSSAGKFVGQFEEQLAGVTGVKAAVAVVNGTAALHICLKASGVAANDEVLVPALTFVATANAVVYCNAVPHFIDSEEKTLGVDPVKLKAYLEENTRFSNGHCFNKISGRRIKALIVVHTFGHPADLDPLSSLCERFHLDLIEDAAESLGSYYKGRHTGHWGKFTALSFNGNKIVTTGGGGAVITNDVQAAKAIKHLTTTAKIVHPWKIEHDAIGYNYRLPNLNAALGCAQLESLNDFIEQKRKLAERYREAFSAVKGLRFFTEPEFARSNYWLNVLVLDQGYESEKDSLIARTNEAGFMTRPTWTLMPKLPMFQSAPRMDLSVAEDLEARLINIPSSVFLGDLA